MFTPGFLVESAISPSWNGAKELIAWRQAQALAHAQASPQLH
jgi:hypothetical protein